jgi:glycosyltransferase involved in cell wall biosynthesis
MSKEPIPCTFALLTRNSGKTLRPALKFADQFADVLICDGGSTDDTVAIAQAHGARVILQDTAFQDETGKLVDYSGPRNQLLEAAKCDWFFSIDSDEELTPELVAEIRRTVASATNTFVYLVPRKYVYENKLIEAAISYPNRQYRFFHRRHVTQYTKRIHERIRFAADEPVGELTNFLLVPFHYESVAELRRKTDKYIQMEIEEMPLSTARQRFKFGKEMVKRIVAQVIRLFTRRFFKRGHKLPLRFELLQIKYNFDLGIQGLFKKR